MNYRILVIIFCLMPHFSALADASVPSDIERFISVAEVCSHLAEEWDNSLPKAQQEEIERKASYYCAQTKEQYRALLTKHKDDFEITKQLYKYKPLVDSISD